MSGDEEDLKAKLIALEKNVNDPGVDARQEEIWARMVTVQERVRLLKTDLEKSSQPTEQLMDEETTKRAQKVGNFSVALSCTNCATDLGRLPNTTDSS